MHGKADAAFLCIFNGVIHQVYDDLTDTPHIPFQLTWNILINIIDQFQTGMSDPVFHTDPQIMKQ